MRVNFGSFGLLEHCYKKFNKAVYAGLCAKVAKGAREGDALCLQIFKEAGVSLGEYIAALLPSIDPVSPIIGVARPALR